MIKAICRFLWKTEWIPLGPLAPYILGGMIGRMPHRVKEKKNDR